MSQCDEDVPLDAALDRVPSPDGDDGGAILCVALGVLLSAAPADVRATAIIDRSMPDTLTR